MSLLPVRGIKIRKTAKNQTSLVVTSAIDHSVDNLFTVEMKSAMILLALQQLNGELWVLRVYLNRLSGGGERKWVANPIKGLTEIY